MKKKLLIGIFLFTLFVPNIAWKCVKGYINTETTENRALSDKPELTLKNWSVYPQEYEEYYNDHLAFKSQLVNLRSLIDFKLLNIVDSEKVLLGKDNWLFYKSAGVAELADEQPIADYQGINKYTEEEMNRILENIRSVDTWLDDRKVEFSILICPNKEHVYSEYLPDSILQIEKECKADSLVDYLEKNSSVPVIYPINELMANKDSYQLYYKYDTHWNCLAGFIAEQSIKESIYEDDSGKAQNITQTESEIDAYHVAEEKNAAPKDLAGMINLDNCFNDDSYYYIDDYKPEVNINLIEKSEDGVLDVYNSNAEDERRVLVIRDSYGEALMNYLPKDFQNVIFVHRNGFDSGFIDVYQPDIVIYQIVERATNDMYDLKHIFGLE